LHFRSEPLPAKEALFVRVVVEGPAGEVLYDDPIRADEDGLAAGTRNVAEATGVEANSIEPRIAGIIVDANRQASRRTAGPPDDPDDVLAGIMDLPSFLNQQVSEDWLVSKLLVAGEPVVMGGPKKSLKTSVGIDLAVSLASGRPFLGVFRVPKQVRTLVLSGESSRGTIQRHVKLVCQERGVAPKDCALLLGARLPRLSDLGHLARLGAYLRDKQVGVVMIDPMYLCLLQSGVEVSAANLFQVGPLLLEIARVCLDAGATPVLVHHARKDAHSRKSRANEPLDLDDLAFAGFGEFARQWVLVSRREPFMPDSGSHKLWLSVGGSAGQSGLWGVDIEEGRLGADFGGRRWSVKVLEGRDVQREVTAVRQQRKADKTEAEKLEARRLVGRFLLKAPAAETVSQIAQLTGLNRKRVQEAVGYYHQTGAVEPVKVPKGGGRSGRREYDGWQPTPALLNHIPMDTPLDGAQDGVLRPPGAARAVHAPGSGAAPRLSSDDSSASAGPPLPATPSCPERADPMA
jgi:replicative DNA helicase